MTSTTVKELAEAYAVNPRKMVKELTLIPGLKFNSDRKKNPRCRIIWPDDLKKIFKHLGDCREI